MVAHGHLSGIPSVGSLSPTSWTDRAERLGRAWSSGLISLKEPSFLAATESLELKLKLNLGKEPLVQANCLSYLRNSGKSKYKKVAIQIPHHRQ